ncbi:protein SIEVE ELEMENT OCCLUSION B-like [Impatiens glandulifera]|uniref:protein SIEVE ELEMENT OCCLUSION B-like n=1 Tax=Impatiens glandulifera TaxID=253017 RepID=UPI001FB0E85F|nr:protein SIEVE ELEMENT OCCLUSION B-like [Impatiens glandulifera]
MSSYGNQNRSLNSMKSDRRMFSASDDGAMMKQILATHSPDGRDIDPKPVLRIIEDMLHRVSPNIDGVIHATEVHHEAVDELASKAIVHGVDGIPEALPYITYKVSCEFSCKSLGGGDAHGTTISILNLLSSYPWDAKVVISLAAFSVNYGEFWLVALLGATNPLAKSLALLKQLPDILEHSNSLKPRFDAVNTLIKAILDVTKCIIDLKELPPNYISQDTPPLSTAMTHIPTAAYWTIRSMVACASQITSLLGMGFEYISSTTEAWELSSLAHKVNNIHGHLMSQLGICYQHIDEKKQVETYQNLIRLFETGHLDNIKILKALIYAKDDLLPLVEGNSKRRVQIEVLRKKTVMLLISDLDILHEQIIILNHIYQESKLRPELHYEIVWLPIVKKKNPWTEADQHRFMDLQNKMPWYMLHHPSLLDPAVIKYITEVWHFTKKLILVTLDPHGKVVCQDALNMVWIWGNAAYPFSAVREKQLWEDETWTLELLVDNIDPSILQWIAQEKYICLLGGEDLGWIRNFTNKIKAVTKAVGISLEMVYVGKSSPKERVRRIIDTINKEKLCDCWVDLTSIWYFWTRLESMFHSKTQHGKKVENDPVMQEVLTMLSFDGSDKGWALISKGSSKMAKSKGDTLIASLDQFGNWEENARNEGFVHALDDNLAQHQSAHHCNRLILPGITGGVPEMVICAECSRPMEKYFMYRCCTD